VVGLVNFHKITIFYLPVYSLEHAAQRVVIVACRLVADTKVAHIPKKVGQYWIRIKGPFSRV